MSNSNKQSRYPGIRSFQENESALFFGRSRETKELYSLIKVEQFVVLFAKSGLGKTSLLNAGVLPLLEQEEYSAVHARFQDTSISPSQLLETSVEDEMEKLQLKAMIEKRLKAWCGNRKPSLWEYLKACSMVMAYLPATPVLVLDQFEEFFSHSKEDQQPLVQLLADIIFGRVPNKVQEQLQELQDPTARDEQWAEPLDWKLIFAIRSDRLSMLDSLSKQIPPILSNRYQLKPLNRKKAEEAILLPAQSTAYDFESPTFEYSDEALDVILNNLSNEKGEIESFQLQIICGHLEELVIEKDIKEVHPDHIGGDAGIKDILNNYYRNRIDSIEKEKDRELASKLIEEGLIVDGARVSLAESIIFKRYHISRSLLNILLDTRLIKPENTHLGKAYEVSHDTLVEPILASFNERRLEEERIQREREKAEQERQLAEQKRKLEEEQERRKKANRRTMIAAGLAILAFIASGIAVLQWISAQKARNEAEKATVAAVKAQENLAEELEKSDSLKTEVQRQLGEFQLEKIKQLERKASMLETTRSPAEAGVRQDMLQYVESVLENPSVSEEEKTKMEELLEETKQRIEKLK